MRARCPICTSSFVHNDYAVLQCGHAFHLACILQWLEQSKTCPNCRVRTTERQIIRQVFFDYADQSTLNESMVDETNTNNPKVDELTTALEKEASEHCKTKETLRSVERAKEKTDLLLTRERETVRTTVPALRERVTQLEMMLQDQQHIKRQLDQAKNRLQASEFYHSLVNCSVEAAEQAIDRYLTADSGQLETGKFLSLVRRQLDDTKKQLTESGQQYRQSELRNGKLERRNAQLKRLVQALRQEHLSNRDGQTSTPHNVALRPILSTTGYGSRVPFSNGSLRDNASPGIGFTFEETDDFEQSLVDSALRVPTHRAKVVDLQPPPPPFPIDEIENNEPTVSSSLLDVTVEIPRSVLGRVFGGSPKKSVTSDGMGGARKPTVPIGEVIAAHRRPLPPPSRSKSKQHSSKSMNNTAPSRPISHFFSRIPSASPSCSSSVNVSDEITID